MPGIESGAIVVQDEAIARVLVVDDDITTRQILESLLSPHFQVESVGSGADALTAVSVSVNAFDIIILDLVLPDLSGFEVFSRLQSVGRLEGVPVVFLTSRIETRHEVHGLGLGAIDYIHKPVNGEQLISRLRRHLRSKSLYDFMSAQKEFLEILLEEKNRSN